VCEIKLCVDQPPPLTQGTYTIDDEPHQLVKRERSLSKVSCFQFDNQVDLTVTTNLAPRIPSGLEYWGHVLSGGTDASSASSRYALVIQGINLTPRSAEPSTIITHPLRGGEDTTNHLHMQSFNPRHCSTDPLQCTLSPHWAPFRFLRPRARGYLSLYVMTYTRHRRQHDILTLPYASLPPRRP